MPDMRRMDLSNDLDALLQDVKAATEEVKQRQEADKRKEARAAEKEKSRKMSAVIIGVSVVALFVLAYFVVFAGPKDQDLQSSPSANRPAPRVIINPGPQSNNSRSVAVPTMPVRPQPPDNYEQPRGGM